MNTNSYTNEYLAGLWDGEGSIGLWAGGPKGEHRLTVYVSIEMSHAQLIRGVAGKFGGNVYRRAPRRVEHAGGYMWRATGRRAMKLLAAIGPHLVLKRPQYQCVMAWYATVKPLLTVPYNAEQASWFHAMSMLNRRGPRGDEPAPEVPLGHPTQMELC